MSAGLPVLLAGGVDPKDASPGIGAFVTFLILALVIILLAWSFTRHQRRIRARVAQEAEQRETEHAEDGDAQRTGQEGAASSSDPDQSAGEEPSHESAAADQPGATAADTVQPQGPPPPATDRPEDDGGASR